MQISDQVGIVSRGRVAWAAATGGRLFARFKTKALLNPAQIELDGAVCQSLRQEESK